MSTMKITNIKIDDLKPYDRNARTHSHEQIAQLRKSIREFGFINPVLIDSKNIIIAGHARCEAAKLEGIAALPCIYVEHLSEAQKRAYIIADNKLAMNAGWDDQLLAAEITALQAMNFDVEMTGFSLDEIDSLLSEESNTEIVHRAIGNGFLAEKFMVPPFSVLNAREGWWQNRKQKWLSIGLKSGEGRDDNLVFDVKNRTDTGQRIKRVGGGTSVFDPVLCELVYLWFSAKNALVLDPFAGGSVRGVVAAKLERNYVGQDLRPEQIAENEKQRAVICAGDTIQPQWIVGDSRNIDKTCEGIKADLVFSCPPYADLEVYSDDPNDISNLDYHAFKAVYFDIIKKSCALLKNDSFACFVVGEARDKNGLYYNFVGDTIEAFLQAGLAYYNEAILITVAGSLPLRAGKAFVSSRKLGKTHQNVLVFVKGNPKKATQKLGDVDVSAALNMAADGLEYSKIDEE